MKFKIWTVLRRYWYSMNKQFKILFSEETFLLYNLGVLSNANEAYLCTFTYAVNVPWSWLMKAPFSREQNVIQNQNASHPTSLCSYRIKMDENGAQESCMDFYAQFKSLKTLEKKFLKSNHWFSLAVQRPASQSSPIWQSVLLGRQDSVRPRKSGS